MLSQFPPTYTFLVRIWREPQVVRDRAPEWRGVIEHVNTQQRAYFCDLDKLGAFVSAETGWPAAEPRRRWASWLNKIGRSP